ncbi:manganese and iron superoxide dismutase [Mytilinidion resinicola]|uniref:Manganese and iron superoxide dismutase n=1 Tax=Mytilinidion resinicola TaxID=574789 RepID=A0A6A6YNT4_9PEZI|nr:manganese and iron superoxide dismutase [Mytilinidion resinicola]KAF2810401.1 manganese and iron superoxide dismutase [Mytilinidion resinicola]
MIIQPALRVRRHLFRSADRAARCFSQSAPSRAHKMPVLNHEAEMRREGIPGLYSPDGVAIAWTEYHGMLLDKLNEMTAGGPEADKEPKHLLIQYARDPTNASLFNYASMAWNNHFFFKGISRTPSPMTATLSASLANEFGSIQTLRDEFLATANSMFGPGFVWLVKTKPTSYTSNFRILPTYIAGSPLPGAHYRRQAVDMNTQNAESAAASGISPAELRTMGVPVNSVGRFGPHTTSYAKQPKLAYGGVDVVPLLCVSTWEHSWLRDWRIAGGKENFLAAWWDRIDWKVVEDLMYDGATAKTGSRVDDRALSYNR